MKPLLLLKESDEIQDQMLVFAYENYKDLLYNDPLSKDKYQTAARISKIFNIDCAFFFYADEYGVETALEFWKNIKYATEKNDKKKFMEIFNDDND